MFFLFVCVFVCEKNGPHVQFIAHTSFADPLQITVEFPLDLLLSSELHELTSVLHTLPLFGKLPSDTQTCTNTHAHTTYF